MPLEPEQLLHRAVDAGALDAQKGQAALSVYARLKEMGADFSFGEFLVERGLLARMAVDAFETESGETFSAVDTLGDFELVELLGEGESGAVFKATQKSLERDVAVKVLNTEIAQDAAAVERFLREARAVAKLNHPNVVHGYSAGTEHGLHYFAMEFLDGGSATSLMEDEGGRLSERRALEIVRQAAEGLKAAHAHGILHRDVKPDNILLTGDGVAKLTDLGISQVTHATADGGTFWGSPSYVAPEIIRGTSAADARCDIYSLGATLFELLIGAPPFLDEDPNEILRQHLTDEPLDVKQLRPELNAKTATLVKLMLAKEPTERALSAEVVAKAIEKILLDLDAQSAQTPAHGTPRVAPPVKKLPLHPAANRPGTIRPVLKKNASTLAARPALRPAPAKPAAVKRPVQARPGVKPRVIPGRGIRPR